MMAAKSPGRQCCAGLIGKTCEMLGAKLVPPTGIESVSGEISLTSLRSYVGFRPVNSR